MQLDSGTAIVLAALSLGVAAGCLIYLIRIRLALQAQQLELSRKMDELTARLTPLAPSASQQPTEVPSVAAAASEEPAPMEAVSLEDPETLAAITAAIAAFLGHRARIRSLRAVHTEPEAPSAWLQQGRAFVQSSHNFNPHR
ncbi:MAG: hypothetical protein P4L99_23300 [Chthoniobacter sp.]|nr:hypothetical protein [Chthoniobacter sp.]